MLKFVRKTIDQVETLAQQVHCNMVCAKPLVLDVGMLRFAGMVLLGSVISLCLADTAIAQGIAGMANTAAGQGDQVKEAFKRIFQAGGVLTAGYGGYNWWRKGKEGENSRISAGQITVPIVAGAALGSVSFLIKTAAETVGMPGVQ